MNWPNLDRSDVKRRALQTGMFFLFGATINIAIFFGGVGLLVFRLSSMLRQLKAKSGLIASMESGFQPTRDANAKPAS